MSELFFMVTITERSLADKFIAFYESHHLDVSIGTVGYGTAVSEVLDYFGLESSEKVVLMHVITDAAWHDVKRGLQNKMRIDIPGTGIAFIVPLSAIGGKQQLAFLTSGQNYVKGEESILKETKYELLVVIANQGYSEVIMDAARTKNAGGGTVIHAKGTGMNKAEHFLGVTLVPEREMLFIVVKSSQKHEIMRAIMDKAGLDTKAHAIVFSLPVTSTAGMRLMEDDLGDE